MSSFRSEHRRLRGRVAEWLAALWLQAHGCRIVARGRRVAGVEVDLVADSGARLLVVEVKSRRSGAEIPLEDLVSREQLRRLRRAADVLGARRRRSVRIDLVQVRWGAWPLVRWHHGPFDPHPFARCSRPRDASCSGLAGRGRQGDISDDE